MGITISDKKSLYNNKNLDGLILLETLIALFLGLLLLACLLLIYLLLMRQTITQISWSTLQEHFNIATRVLQRDVQLAGYLGCVQLAQHPVITYNPAYNLTLNNRLLITHSDFSGHDILIVQHRSLISNVLLHKMLNNYELYVSRHLKILPGNILLLADCDSAEITKVASVTLVNATMQKIILSQPLHKQYAQNTEVGLFERNSYTIAAGSLYQHDINGHNIAVVAGIHDMRIRDVLQSENTWSDDHAAIEATRLTGIVVQWQLTDHALLQLAYQVITVSS
jgi:hypothetical protein